MCVLKVRERERERERKRRRKVAREFGIGKGELYRREKLFFLFSNSVKELNGDKKKVLTSFL